MQRLSKTIGILVAVGALMLTNGAHADSLQQAAADELATPVGCVSYGDGSVLDDYIWKGGDTGQNDVCAQGGSACGEAETFAHEIIARHSGFDCSSGTSKCQGSWWESRMWEIEGEYKGGDGTVRFWIQCGSDKSDSQGKHKIVCDAVGKLNVCNDGVEKDDGEFGCWYDIIDGDPIDVAGKCVDPADPTVVYRAALWVADEVYDVFQHAEVVE